MDETRAIRVTWDLTGESKVGVPAEDDPLARIVEVGPGSDGVGWRYLSDDWLQFYFAKPGWVGWEVEVLAIEQAGRIRCGGFRIKPPEGEYVTVKRLEDLDPEKYAHAAHRAKSFDVDAVSSKVKEAARSARRPYGGQDPAWQEAVREVIRAAGERHERPAKAVMRTFGVPSATAYRWIRDVRTPPPSGDQT